MAFNPASAIIKKLGGEKAVQAATGTAYTAPYRWQASVESGGTGGRIPSKHIPTLIAFAKDNGIELATDEFFTEPTLVEKDAPSSSETHEDAA